MWHGCCFVDDVIETSCINGCAVHVRHATISCHTINLVKQDAPHNLTPVISTFFNALSDGDCSLFSAVNWAMHGIEYMYHILIPPSSIRVLHPSFVHSPNHESLWSSITLSGFPPSSTWLKMLKVSAFSDFRLKGRKITIRYKIFKVD